MSDIFMIHAEKSPAVAVLNFRRAHTYVTVCRPILRAYRESRIKIVSINVCSTSLNHFHPCWMIPIAVVNYVYFRGSGFRGPAQVE